MFSHKQSVGVIELLFDASGVYWYPSGGCEIQTGPIWRLGSVDAKVNHSQREKGQSGTLVSALWVYRITLSTTWGGGWKSPNALTMYLTVKGRKCWKHKNDKKFVLKNCVVRILGSHYSFTQTSCIKLLCLHITQRSLYQNFAIGHNGIIVQTLQSFIPSCKVNVHPKMKMVITFSLTSENKERKSIWNDMESKLHNYNF